MSRKPDVAVAERERMLDILRQNTGFDDPERWITYASRHTFKRVHSTQILTCPDCGANSAHQLGQYIYYSTLMRLRECSGCGLIWSDVKLDPVLVTQHFQGAYKDDTYFEQARRLIFRKMALLIEGLAGCGARVLDIGGAKGHLMDHVRRKRPDLRITMNDISAEAIRCASQMFGFETVHGGAQALAEYGRTYDVVVVCDALYYVPDIAEFWTTLSRLLVPGGVILLRIPNKLAMIRLSRAAMKARRFLWRRQELEDRIKHFNPEHVYVFSRSYLSRRLRSLGFRDIHVVPTPPLCSSLVGAETLLSGASRLATALNRMSGGRVVPSPSMVVIARYSPAESDMISAQHRGTGGSH